MFFSKIFRFFFCCGLLSFFGLGHGKNLEEWAQDFVIETKKITLQQYPHAFNPSLIRWKDRWLMSFRVIENPEQISPFCSAAESSIGLVWLDDDLEPMGTPQFINLDHPKKQRPFLLTDDARLIVKGEQLYIIYSANKEAEVTDAGFRVYVAELIGDENNFFVVSNECLTNFEGENPYRREKNWTPFIYDNKLLLTYQLSPHKIFYPLLDGSELCETISTTIPSSVWEWGELRGGTPAFKLNEDYYLGVFHSTIYMKTIHSNDLEVPHYFAGAYLFSAHPPFEIKFISPEPIVGSGFYQGPVYSPYWHPVCVVFPCGLVIHEKEVWIAYGRQDHEIWIGKLDKKQLIDSLIPVSTIID